MGMILRQGVVPLALVTSWLVIIGIAIATLFRTNEVRSATKIFWAAAIIMAPLAGVLFYIIAGPATNKQLYRNNTRYNA
ncbi:MAG: hypothetical protein JWN76_3283 [Chitinophagaceae bacterium]|nr:hypothetical protein [Chitinophagaceae bacterium]